MALPRPDVEELSARLRNEISFRALNGAPVLPMSMEDVLSYTVAGSLYEMWGVVDSKFKDTDPETCSCDALYPYARRRGLFPQTAKQSTGYVLITGTVGAAIPIGSQWVDSAGQLFSIDVAFSSNPTVIDANGRASVRLKSVVGGSSGNIAGNSLLTLASTTPGIDTEGLASIAGFTGGNDTEDCDAFRRRILARRSAGVISTNRAWYIDKVLSWPGVTRACISDCDSCCSDSYIDIFVFFDDVYGPYGVPPSSVTDAMTAWLFGSVPGAGLGLAPVGQSGFVRQGIPSPVDISIACGKSCVGSATAYVRASIETYFKASVCAGGSLCKTSLEAIISRAVGFRCVGRADYNVDPGVTESRIDFQFPCGVFPYLRNLSVS